MAEGLARAPCPAAAGLDGSPEQGGDTAAEFRRTPRPCRCRLAWGVGGTADSHATRRRWPRPRRVRSSAPHAARCGPAVGGPHRTTRDGAAVARRAHNPKVGGSNPPPATTRLGGSRGVDPPVPIPNTVVKRPSADDTARATGWDNRPLPGHPYPRGCQGVPGTLDPFVALSHVLHCGCRFTPGRRESVFAFIGGRPSLQ